MNARAQAILLAAGRGERMRPLTDICPKPLLEVRGKPLMQWPLQALQQGGCAAVVVNTAWLGEQIENRFGDSFSADSLSQISHQVSQNVREQLLKTEQTPGRKKLLYSREGTDFGGALETAGGISRALPLLDDVFWVAAGDVFAPGFEFAHKALSDFKAGGKLAHIWLVPNPQHNPLGDFGLSPQGLALNLPKDSPLPKFTYSTLGLYRQALFAPPFCGIPPGNPQGLKAGLASLLRVAMDAQLVSAEVYRGAWADIGTPQRLDALNRQDSTALR